MLWGRECQKGMGVESVHLMAPRKLNGRMSQQACFLLLSLFLFQLLSYKFLFLIQSQWQHHAHPWTCVSSGLPAQWLVVIHTAAVSHQTDIVEPSQARCDVQVPFIGNSLSPEC